MRGDPRSDVVPLRIGGVNLVKDSMMFGMYVAPEGAEVRIETSLEAVEQIVRLVAENAMNDRRT